MSEVMRLSLDMEYPFQYMEDKNGNLCYYADYAALQAQMSQRDAQMAALTAENVALKESVNHAGGCISAAESEGLVDALESKDGEKLAELIHRRLCHAHLPVETPATDAAANEMQAQGVELFAELMRSYIGKPNKNDAAASYCAREAIKFANQLREGK
ncbi:hypothetical protein [Mixta calida]|uniref:hypothetical protein n=1 Tax=Mixta calida TaxID=665913 RepID=UPI0011A2D26B|nr:hypothetical protein [Mixta calida]DAV72781.1 MAG TPA: hypothetical protein [Caudoviricetes sp.]